MKKILFLNPPLSLEDLYEDLAEGGSELPPLNIAVLAAVARDHCYQTTIVDSLAERLDYDKTLERILDFDPDYLGITSTTISIFYAAEMARLAKQSLPGLKVILGGAHITAAPQETMRRFPQFDIGVIGEGEDTLIDLLHTLETGKKPLPDVEGIIYRDNGEIRMTPRRAFIQDLDRIPYPAWDLLPDLVRYYQPAVDSLYRSPASSLVTSRGCPGQCVFCDRAVFGNRVRGYSAGYVLGMIKRLRYEYGIRDLFIHDDNFVVLRKRLKQICNAIIKEKIDITWSCLGRLDSLDLSLLPLMKKAGCWQINYGVESGSQKILDLMNKKIKVEQAAKVINATRRAGIRVKGLFIIGSFGETTETIKETLDFIKKVKMDDFHACCYTPFPGTEADRIAEQYGTIDRDWRKMNMFTPDKFIPHGMTKEEVDYWYRKAYRTFYMRPCIIWYYFKKMRHPAMARKILRGFSAFMRFTSNNKRKSRVS